MKKSLIILFALLFSFVFIFGIQNVDAKECDLQAIKLNQDPYPAMPGEYVKLVFQITGMDNPECGVVRAELIEDYPLSFDETESNKQSAYGGTFTKPDYKTYWNVPFKPRLDSNALDGDNRIELKLTSQSSGGKLLNFSLNVQDSRTDFEVSIKDYDKTTREMTFEILNVGEYDVEAVTVELENQENAEVKGAKRNIIGSLDSNEDTTFTFEVLPKNGEINLNVLYTDDINERRSVTKAVEYDSNYFTGRASESGGTSVWTWIFLIVIIGLIVWYVLRRRKRKKEMHHAKHGMK